MVLFFISLYFLLLFLVLANNFSISLNFFTFSNSVFLFFIFPKIYIYQFYDSSVFSKLDIISFDWSVDISIALITIFMMSINIVYLLNVFSCNTSQLNNNIKNIKYTKKSINLVNYTFILPLFAIAFILYLYLLGISIESLLTKKSWTTDGSINSAYIMQKVTQVIKSGMYLALVYVIVTSERPVKLRSVYLFIFLTSLVYLTSSQRSGIIIMLLELIMVLQLAGVLKLKHYLYFSALFLGINILVLNTRFVDSGEAFSLFEKIFRRYFFELEKITAIYEFSVDSRLFIDQPIWGIFSWSNIGVPDTNVHFFIGSEIFGEEGNGIPPSVLGEMILYFGPIMIVPLTILMTLLIAFIEKVKRTSSNPIMVILCVIVLSKAYFLLLNTDVMSTVRRTLLDVSLLIVALVLYDMVGMLVRQFKGREASAG